MADSGLTMDHMSRSSNQDLSQGFVPTRGLVRRDTASSAGSEKYLPMPAGHWLLDLHGNCPRCHHHHTAVKVKITVNHDSSKLSRVQCENCKERWLAFAGNNSTQISLLSTATINPDPVEKEVRLTLINMVKSATTITAIASPTLARIPEASPDTSGEPSSRALASKSPRPAFRAPRTQSHVSFHLPPPSVQDQGQVPPFSSPVNISVVNDPGRRRSRHSLSNLKQRVKARFPSLGRLNLRQLLGISKGSKLPTKKAGKLPAEVPVAEDQSASKEHAPEPVAHGEQPPGQVEPNLTEGDIPSSSTRNEEATRFIESFKNDAIDRMDEKERTAWMRGKITQFKTERAKSYLSTNSTRVDIGTQVPQHLPEFFGLGSHFGYLDRFSASDPSLRTRPISISERTSEAPTAIDDSALASNPRLSRLFQQEYRRSGSPRPQSLHSVPRSWQQLRQYRDQARNSLDSTATGGAVRSALINRDWAMSRWSRGSIWRASTLGLHEMFMSQTSFHHPMNEEEPTDDELNPPPPSPMPQSPTRRPST